LLPAAEALLEDDRSLVCSTVVTFRILFGTKGCCFELSVVLVLLLLVEGEGLVVVDEEEVLVLEGPRLPDVVDALSFLEDEVGLVGVFTIPSLLDCVERTSDGVEEPRPLSLLARPNCGESGTGIVGLQYPARVKEAGS